MRGGFPVLLALSLVLAACHGPVGACGEVPVLGPEAGPVVDALTAFGPATGGALTRWERRDVRLTAHRVDLELARNGEVARLRLVHPSRAASAAQSRFFGVQADAEGTPGLALALAEVLRARETTDPWTWRPRPTSRDAGRDPVPASAAPAAAPLPFPWGALAAGLGALALGLAIARLRVGHLERWPLRAPSSHLSKPVAVATVSILAAVLLVPHVLRWRALGPGSYDLGLFAHAFWNASQGCGFFNSPEGLDHLGWHMSPLLYALVPVYALFASPLVLLLANGAALVLASWPLYRLARAALPAGVALLVAALLLAHPALSSLNRDFHPVALAVPFLMLAVAGAVTGRHGWLAAGVGLALACEETVTLPVAGLGLYLLAIRGARVRGAVLLAVAVATLVAAVTLWLPAFGGDGGLPTLRRYASLGATWREVLASPWLRPEAFWGRLASEATLGYLVRLLAPLAFLPLLAPRAWLALVPPLAQVLLTDGEALRSMNGHYEALLLPGLALATLQGLQRVARWIAPASSPDDVRHAAAAWMVLIPLLAAPWLHADLGRGHLADLAPPPDAADLRRVLEAVPPAVGVAAPAALQARLADRPVAVILDRPSDLDDASAPFDALLWPPAAWGPVAPPPGFAPALVTPSCTLLLRTPEAP